MDYSNSPVLIQGDCMELIDNIPKNSIQLILIDPPYGMTKNSWDTPLQMEDFTEVNGKVMTKDEFLLHSFQHGLTYEETLNAWKKHKKDGLWKKFKRILKPDGAVIIFSLGKYTNDLLENPGIKWRYNFVWEKTHPVGFLNANKMPLRGHEDICVFFDAPEDVSTNSNDCVENIHVFYNKLPVYNPQKTSGHPRKVALAKHKLNSANGTNYGEYGKNCDYDSTERHPTSVLRFPLDKASERIHPTQKPVDLCKFLIKSYTNEDDFVFDGCMGSGTSGVAAMQAGRKYIGIEKNVDIFNKATDRLFAQYQTLESVSNK